ncbi:hypothetical protein [Lysobacter gummosus]|uniref:hypothetical protein n=1 Tax=Lysobacter gummosus TaxID=262324 RepID=UPI0036387D7A
MKKGAGGFAFASVRRTAKSKSPRCGLAGNRFSPRARPFFKRGQNCRAGFRPQCFSTANNQSRNVCAVARKRRCDG